MARQSELAVTRPPAIALAADDVDDDAHDVDESPMRDGRNENSLAYLCQRFCEMYRNHSDPINIDLAAKELGIQRRRMYEILNIIQSVGLVSRLRASFYRWDGQDKMTAALERLKEEGLAHLASTRSAANGSKSAAGCMSPEGQRRKAVATALGERFVQIFLCNEVPQPIILEDIMGLFTSCVGSSAASGSPAASLTNQTSCARRLYDIANVFCSIGLVRKSCSAATDNRRKKRLYVWIGPVPPATTTPLRPQRASIVAPSASPGAGSSKRLKREPTDTPPPSSARKKSRLASGGLNLEASIIKAERDAETNTSGPSTAIHKVLQHPVVAALRGSSLSTPLIASLSTANASSASSSLTAGSKRALLIARALEPPAPMSPSSLFNPPNAKDSPPPRSIESSRGSKRPLKFSSMSSSSASPPQLRTASCSTTSKPTATAPPTATAATSSSSSSSSCTSTCSCSSSSSSTDGMSPALLRAQIEQLRKELADAKTREQELLKRIEMQDSQINKLIDAKVLSSSGRPTPSSSSSTNATNSPISSLVFSPFHNAFSSLTASPSPFSSNNFFATGLTGSAHRSGRPPFLRKARIGPHLVDPADTDDALLLSPATTSIASTLLMSPIVDTASGPSSTSASTAADKEKENAHHLALLDSPVRGNESSSYVAPSTPPCNLIATVASSLLSLTPSQSIGLTMASDDRGDTSEDDDEAEAARANASSPEPRAVRTPATIGAPSSPSPSAKGAKALARVHRTSSALDVLSPLKAAKPRITDCLS